MRTCLVIGAGMAGLSAAKLLTEEGLKVIVLDKGRGVGGRMATRRVDEVKFDHGAQFFSAKSSDFQLFVDDLFKKNIIQEWHLEQGDSTFSHSRFCGKHGMNQIPKSIAEGLLVKTNEKVVQLELVSNQVRAICESGASFFAEAVVCTIPAPQAMELLKNSRIILAENTIQGLSSIEYYPCIAVMAVLNEATNIPNPGGKSFENKSFSWIADNYKKGISPRFSATIHASPEFSEKYFEADLRLAGEKLLAEAKEWIAATSIESFEVHRWKYSLAKNRYPEYFIKDNTFATPIYFAGDGFGNGNIEGAFLSGIKTAQSIVS